MPLRLRVVLDLVRADALDREVLRLRMREVESADRRRRRHRERFGEIQALRARIEQVEQPRLLAVIGAGRIAEGRTDAAILLVDQIVVRRARRRSPSRLRACACRYSANASASRSASALTMIAE